MGPQGHCNIVDLWAGLAVFAYSPLVGAALPCCRQLAASIRQLTCVLCMLRDKAWCRALLRLPSRACKPRHDFVLMLEYADADQDTI